MSKRIKHNRINDNVINWRLIYNIVWAVLIIIVVSCVQKRFLVFSMFITLTGSSFNKSLEFSYRECENTFTHLDEYFWNIDFSLCDCTVIHIILYRLQNFDLVRKIFRWFEWFDMISVKCCKILWYEKQTCWHIWQICQKFCYFQTIQNVRFCTEIMIVHSISHKIDTIVWKTFRTRCEVVCLNKWVQIEMSNTREFTNRKKKIFDFCFLITKSQRCLIMSNHFLFNADKPAIELAGVLLFCCCCMESIFSCENGVCHLSITVAIVISLFDTHLLSRQFILIMIECIDINVAKHFSWHATFTHTQTSLSLHLSSSFPL